MQLPQVAVLKLVSTFPKVAEAQAIQFEQQW
jgi:hypothetical protein